MKLRKILIILLASFASISFANQKIDLLDEKLAKEVLLGKTWTCHLVDDHGKTDGIWTFKSVKGNKVSGKFEILQYMACSADQFKGKLKGNTLKYTARTNHSSCVAFNGTLNFFKDEGGIIKADGVYTYGGLRFRGKYTCE